MQPAQVCSLLTSQDCALSPASALFASPFLLYLCLQCWGWKPGLVYAKQVIYSWASSVPPVLFCFETPHCSLVSALAACAVSVFLLPAPDTCAVISLSILLPALAVPPDPGSLHIQHSQSVTAAKLPVTDGSRGSHVTEVWPMGPPQPLA